MIVNLNRLILHLHNFLGPDFVLIGGVVDWYHFNRPIKDYDVYHPSPPGNNAGGYFFGPKYRYKYEGKTIEVFSTRVPKFEWCNLGCNIQTMEDRLETIKWILTMPRNSWTIKKAKLMAMVPLYQAKIEYE